MKTKLCLLVLIFISITACQSIKQNNHSDIKINQVGFNPRQDKIAVLENKNTVRYKIVDQQGNIIVNGVTLPTLPSQISQKSRSIIDLNAAKDTGRYTLLINNDSITFEVAQNILTPLSKSALRTFYYQRTGIPILEEYAGKWNRVIAHPDTLIYIHPTVTNQNHEETNIISSPKGWYDAGDYNKYIVNSAYTIGLILTGYQLIPEYYENLVLNIPESNNNIPDILDEMYYNLEWMLTMQDAHDGGVYHKLTTPNFEGFIKPDKCKQKRYVVAKSTAATLDFAAVMAQASRIYKKYDIDFTAFATQSLIAAEKAYKWAKENPQVIYNQNELNKKFKPQITTGEYGDKHLDDEFFWAACELYISTHKQEYLEDINKYIPNKFSNHSWGNVESLGVFSLLLNKSDISNEMRVKLQQQILAYAKKEVEKLNNSSFKTMFGNEIRDFGWGALSEKCINPTISILIAGKLCDNTLFDKYLQVAFHNMDYILGRNATGYCYVTGFVTKSPMNIHHRLSASDEVDEPIPGFLVGGPNPSQQDKNSGVHYKSNFADESYEDVLPSYASNEIAINWNASLVVLAGLLDAWGK